MYVGERLGYRSIANRLNDEAIPSPRDGHWSSTTNAAWGIGTIRSILLNGTYTGDTYWNRRSFAKFHRISGRIAHERPRHRADKPDWNPKDDWIVVKGTHPAIISQEMYQEVLGRPRAGGHRIGKRTDLSRTSTRSPYLLSGILRCICGHAFNGQAAIKAKRKKSGEPVRTAYYLCGGYSKKGRKLCVRCAIPKEEMETRVWQMVESRLAFTGSNCRESFLPRPNAVDGRLTGPEFSHHQRGQLQPRLHGTPQQQKGFLRTLIHHIEVNPRENRAAVFWVNPSRSPTKTKVTA